MVGCLKVSEQVKAGASSNGLPNGESIPDVLAEKTDENAATMHLSLSAYFFLPRFLNALLLVSLPAYV